MNSFLLPSQSMDFRRFSVKTQNVDQELLDLQQKTNIVIVTAQYQLLPV